MPSETMRAAVLGEPGTITTTQLPIPTPGHEDVPAPTPAPPRPPGPAPRSPGRSHPPRAAGRFAGFTRVHAGALRPTTSRVGSCAMRDTLTSCSGRSRTIARASSSSRPWPAT